MSKLRIKDAQLLPNVNGAEKIPTGGRGDYAVSVDQIKDYVRGGLPQQIEDHISDTENPHQVSKSQVGLGNVDNTSDVDKPISTAIQEALDLKADQSTTYTKIEVDGRLGLKADKTYVDSRDLLKADKNTTYTKTEVDTALNLKANKAYVDSQDSLKADKTYVDSALSSLSTQASKFYPTLAEANADIANITVNQAVQVGEATNGGLWYKATAGTTSLTKSPYDPLTQSKGFTKSMIELQDGSNIVVIRDSAEKIIFLIDASGSVFIPKLSSDIATSIKDARKSLNYIFETSGGNILNIVDVNGSELVRIDSFGDFYFTKIGNLRLTLNQLQSQIDKSSISIARKINDSLALTVGKGSLSIDKYAFDDQPDFTEIKQSISFSTEELNALNLGTTLANIRIPSFLRVSKNKYILFFQINGAAQSGEHADFTPTSLGCITVDFNTDGTFTRSAITLLEKYFTESDTGDSYSCINPCSVVLPSGRVMLYFIERRVGEAAFSTKHRILYKYSDDNGETWSAKVDISSFFNMAFYNTLVPGPNQAIVKKYGKNKGRIIIPTWYTTMTYAVGNMRTGYIYSDDNGATYQVGGFYLNRAGNETQVAEDVNGDLLFHVRDDANVGYRYMLRLPDGSKDEFELIVPKIQDVANFTTVPNFGSIIQCENEFDGCTPKLLITQTYGLLNGSNTGSRANLMSYLSYDGGVTWKSHLVEPSLNLTTNYSAPQMLNRDTVVTVCEGGNWRFDIYTSKIKNLFDANFNEFIYGV